MSLFIKTVVVLLAGLSAVGYGDQSASPMPNIAYQFQPIASSYYTKKADNFSASPENTIDGDSNTFWMNRLPLEGGGQEWIQWVFNGKAYVDSVTLNFVPLTAWGGTTNDVLPRQYRVFVRQEGKNIIIKDVTYNREEKPVYSVKLSNVDMVQVVFTATVKDGYVRLKEVFINGEVQETSNFTYKYKMSEEEQRLLTKCANLFHAQSPQNQGAGNFDEEKSEKDRKREIEYYRKAMDDIIAINEEVLNINPDNPYARMNLGQVYIELANSMGDDAGRKKYQKMAIQHLLAADRPENHELKSLYKYLMSLYREQLDQKQYDVYSQKLLKLDAGEGKTGNYYRTLAQSDPYGDKCGEEVYRYAKKSGDIDGFGALLWRYTTSLVRNRQYKEAIEVGNFTAKNYPDSERVKDGQLYQYIAMANMALGKWNDAIKEWENALDGTLRTPGIVEALISYNYLKLNNDVAAYTWYLAYLHQINFSADNPNYVRDVFNNVNKPFIEENKKRGGEKLLTKDFESKLINEYAKYLKKYNIKIENKDKAFKFINSICTSYLRKYEFDVK